MKFASLMSGAAVLPARLAVVAGFLLAAFAAQSAEDADWLAQMRAQEAILGELESSNGPFDPSLIEPISAMIRLLEQQSDHQRIAELQERQLALMRTNLGLESAATLPLLRDMVRTRIALGDADAVGDQMQMIRNLVAGQDDPEALLRTLDALAYWYLTAGAGDSNRERAKSFFEARELMEDAEDIAMDWYGDDNTESVPWRYLGAMNLYQLVALLNSEQGMVSPTVRELVRHDGAMKLRSSARGFSFNPVNSATFTPVVERGELVGELYLREARGKIDDIAGIFEATGNAEAEAMAMVYRSDFQLLLGQGTAFSRYREAMELLRETGVAEERIKLFFSRPQALPVNRFFPTLEEAIAHQEAELAVWRPEDADAIHVAPFVAWDESAPNMRAPISDNAFWEFVPDIHVMELEFNINSRGGVSAVDILNAAPDDRRSRRLAREAARQLRFRPAMEEGRGQRLRDVRMQFLLPRRDD